MEEAENVYLIGRCAISTDVFSLGTLYVLTFSDGRLKAPVVTYVCDYKLASGNVKRRVAINKTLRRQILNNRCVKCFKCTEKKGMDCSVGDDETPGEDG